jgi:hypothetical protein
MLDITSQVAADNDLVAAFFERLWGFNPGHRALFVLPAKQHYFALRTSEALEYSEGLKSDPAYAAHIYHASLFSAGRRTARCSLGARAFWLGIDCGPGKIYWDQIEVVTALIDCRNRSRENVNVRDRGARALKLLHTAPIIRTKENCVPAARRRAQTLVWQSKGGTDAKENADCRGARALR